MLHSPERLEITGGAFNVETAGILECDVLLSLNRPATFEIRLSVDPSVENLSDHPSGETIASLPVPGAPISARWGRTLAFEGIVERLCVEDRAGEDPAVVLRACSAYQLLRSRSTDAVYHNVLLSELAWRVALDLGLKPCVQCPDILLSEVRVEGDALVVLRELTERYGLALAVESQRLHVRESLAGLGRAHVMTPADALIAFDVERSLGGAGGSFGGGPSTGVRRRARVVVSGMGRMRPIDTLEVCGFGRFRDGWYRVESCLLSLEADGWRTELELEGER